VEEPRVTVFTPSHHPRFLDECLRSMLAQTFHDWEWLVVLNLGARWRPEVVDPRVRIVVRDELVGVGAAKRFACGEARGEILVELDHDDLLARNCLQRTQALSPLPCTAPLNESSLVSTPRTS